MSGINTLLVQACTACTNSKPYNTISSEDLQRDGPVSLEKLADQDTVFHMPTKATTTCISNDTAMRMLEAYNNKLMHFTAYTNHGTNDTTSFGDVIKRALLIDMIGISERNTSYFSYKCPLTREKFTIEVYAKYKLSESSPTIIECRAIKDSDKFHLEYAILKMLSPWFGTISILKNKAIVKYNPFAFYAKTIIKISEKTHCYKLLTAIVRISDVSLRLFIIIGSNYAFYKVASHENSKYLNLKTISSTYIVMTGMNFWFST
jgi:hypothetical protein